MYIIIYTFFAMSSKLGILYKFVTYITQYFRHAHQLKLTQLNHIHFNIFILYIYHSLCYIFVK